MIIFLSSCVIWVIAIGLAYVIGWRVSHASIALGHRWGIVAHVTDRSSHVLPTPRIGGLGLAAGIFVPCALLVAVFWLLPRTPEAWGGNLSLIGWLGLSALLYFAVGLADDLWDLSPAVKLLGQVMAVVPVLASGMYFLVLKFATFPGYSPYLFSHAAVALWILFFVNAFNFMDGLDGFAGHFARNVFFWLALTVMINAARDPDLILLMRLEFMFVTLFGAACAGFLRVNNPPAKTFMGDGGSHLLGFLLAIQVVMADGDYYFSVPIVGRSTIIPAPAVWMMLMPFIFDVLVTLVRRARLRQNLLSAHRSHLYQRLMITGMSHLRVLQINLFYFRICGAAGLIYGLTSSLFVHTLLWLFVLCALAQYWLLVLLKEAKEKRK